VQGSILIMEQQRGEANKSDQEIPKMDEKLPALPGVEKWEGRSVFHFIKMMESCWSNGDEE